MTGKNVAEKNPSGGRIFRRRNRPKQGADRAECTEAIGGDHATVEKSQVPADIGTKENSIVYYSSIAQSVERMTVNHDVTGSSPVRGAIFVVRKSYKT